MEWFNEIRGIGHNEFFQKDSIAIQRRPSFRRFCAFKVTCSREPVSVSRSLYALSLSLSIYARQSPTQVTTTVDSARVLEGCAHLRSRDLVSQPASVALSLSAYDSPSLLPAIIEP
jgi:hypothetical protein